jgi:hypothetical protein
MERLTNLLLIFPRNMTIKPPTPVARPATRLRKNGSKDKVMLFPTPNLSNAQ